MPRGCLAQAAARTRDDDNFCFDVIAHSFTLYFLSGSSTAGQLHEFFRVPSPSHRDLRGSRLDFAEIVRGEFH